MKNKTVGSKTLREKEFKCSECRREYNTPEGLVLHNCNTKPRMGDEVSVVYIEKKQGKIIGVYEYDEKLGQIYEVQLESGERLPFHDYSLLLK